MLELISQTYTALKGDAAGLSLGIQIWMKGIALSMLLGFVMAVFDRRALWIGMAMVMIIVSLFIVKGVWPDVPRGQIGTWAHLVFWPPALVGLWWGQTRNADRTTGQKTFVIWKYWVSLVMVISLFLDMINAIKSVV